MYNNDMQQNQPQNSLTPSSDYAKKPKKLSHNKKEKILELCNKNLQLWWNYYGDNLQQFQDDKIFYSDYQWDGSESAKYQQQGKTPYTINKLKPLIRQLDGEVQNMQVGLTVMPLDSETADPKTVTFMADFMRYLAYCNRTSSTYAEAFHNQCVGGWGVIGVGTEYVDDMSFEQEVKIFSFPDPLQVIFDPASQDPNKQSGDFQARYYVISKEEFESKYYAPAPVGQGILGTATPYLPSIDDNSVIIVDFYLKKYKKKKLLQLSNGVDYKIEVYEEDLEITQKAYKMQMEDKGVAKVPPLEVVNSRMTSVATIKCYKCVQNDVLEVYDWPSKYFPYVYVDGFSRWQNGRQISESLIFVARDCQKAYNYAISEALNGLARTRREQIWATPRQVAGNEKIYQNPDRLQGVLLYNHDPEEQGPPHFRPPEELPESLFRVAQAMEEDIYKTLGIYPANRGEIPEQVSGVALGRTITQGNLMFKKILSNLFEGMGTVGRIILDLIPKIYDSERIISLIDETGKTSVKSINQLKSGKINNNVVDSAYKLEIKPIASFASQADALQKALISLAQINPDVSPLVLDIIASTLETPVAPRLVERFQTLVPPNILAQEQGFPPPPPPPPDPMIALTAAKTQQAQSSAALNQAKAQTEGVKVQQSAQDSAMNFQLEQQKLQASRDELIAMTNKAYVDSQAEIGKAQIQYQTEALKGAMAHIANAGRDASAQMTNSPARR